MLLYAITERRMLSGTESERWAELIALARRWARGGVDYIQIREKELPPEELVSLARNLVAAVREEGSRTRVLVNGPAEIALEAGADGVHLPGNVPQPAAGEAHELYRRAGRDAIISCACHSVNEVRAARDASLIVYAPVFEKVDSPQGVVAEGQGLAVLGEACRAAGPTPVFALGGVTSQNAKDCIAAGAAGVAGIRLFLGDEWRKLRSL
jgi:thiamine-phosphate pyrophosphorylase